MALEVARSWTSFYFNVSWVNQINQTILAAWGIPFCRQIGNHFLQEIWGKTKQKTSLRKTTTYRLTNMFFIQYVWNISSVCWGNAWIICPFHFSFSAHQNPYDSPKRFGPWNQRIKLYLSLLERSTPPNKIGQIGQQSMYFYASRRGNSVWTKKAHLLRAAKLGKLHKCCRLKSQDCIDVHAGDRNHFLTLVYNPFTGFTTCL